MPWQPIETAPKDGRTILVWGRYTREPVTARWDGKEFAPCWEGFPIIEYQSDFGTEYKTADPWSHWMPLPQPPRTA